MIQDHAYKISRSHIKSFAANLSFKNHIKIKSSYALLTGRNDFLADSMLDYANKLSLWYFITYYVIDFKQECRQQVRWLEHKYVINHR